MKMIYTIAELQELTEKELFQIMNFKGQHSIFLYSDIKQFRDETKTAILTGDLEIECSSEEVFEELKRGKLRHDLVQATLAGIKHETAIKQDFKAEIESTVKAQIDTLTSLFSATNDKIASEFSDTTKSMNSTIQNMETSISEMQTQYQSKLDGIDIKDYKSKMQKLNIIIKAFSELIED